MKSLWWMTVLMLAVACSSDPSNGDVDAGPDVGGDDVSSGGATSGDDVSPTPDAGGEEVSPTPDVGEPQPDVCIPTSSQELCEEAQAECGAVVVHDGCNENVTVQCSQCAAPLTCGANGVENTCGVEGWEMMVVDGTGNAGKEVSMVLGPDGHPRLAYQANIGGGTVLRFALFDGEDWTTQTVDDGVFAGKHTAIAYDGNAGLHIAGTSFGGSLLYSLSGEIWTSETASPTSRGRIGLAFDGDEPHICVHSESATVLVHYGRDEEGNWTPTTVDGSVAAEARYGDYCSIAVSSDGVVQISYEDNQFRRLKFARLVEGEWQKEVVDDGDSDTAGAYTSLALDSQGHPHIGYRAGLVGDPSIRVASHDGETWTLRTVDANAGTIANFTSIAIDSNDGVHLVYFDSGPGQIKYASPDGDGWDVRAIFYVGSGEDVQSAIALDGDDVPHMAFFDIEGRRLVYMRPMP